MKTMERRIDRNAELDTEVQDIFKLEDEDWSEGKFCCIEPEAGKDVFKALLAGKRLNDEQLQFFFDRHRPFCRYCQEVPIDRLY